MDDTRHTLNELLVDLFNYILLIEEKNLRDQGVKLSMTEVHILEAIEKSESNMMSAIAKRLIDVYKRQSLYHLLRKTD